MGLKALHAAGEVIDVGAVIDGVQLHICWGNEVAMPIDAMLMEWKAKWKYYYLRK